MLSEWWISTWINIFYISVYRFFFDIPTASHLMNGQLLFMFRQKKKLPPLFFAGAHLRWPGPLAFDRFFGGQGCGMHNSLRTHLNNTPVTNILCNCWYYYSLQTVEKNRLYHLIHITHGLCKVPFPAIRKKYIDCKNNKKQFINQQPTTTTNNNQQQPTTTNNNQQQPTTITNNNFNQ